MEEYSSSKGWVNRMNPEDISLLASALVKAQGEIEEAKKGKKNPHFGQKYADLAACWDACRDALQKNDIAVIQLPTEAPAGYVGLVTTILHKSGQSISDKFFMPLRNATDPQAAGSAITYARRYALCAAIGICPVDDDGNAAAPPRPQKTVDAFWWSNRFKGASDKKAVYFELKNSDTQEPLKTKLLKEFGADIKAAVSAAGTKESTNGKAS